MPEGAEILQSRIAAVTNGEPKRIAAPVCVSEVMASDRRSQTSTPPATAISALELPVARAPPETAKSPSATSAAAIENAPAIAVIVGRATLPGDPDFRADLDRDRRRKIVGP